MKYKLNELIESISDTRKVNKNEIILINTSDIENGIVLNHQYVKNQNLKGQFKKRFKKGDILYSEIRPKNKRFAYINFDSEDYIASTKLMVLRRKNELIDNDYLFYILKSNSMINRLQMLAESRSGTFPQITFDELKNIEVEIPELKQQRKIIKILKCIDSKIITNSEINDNLFEYMEVLYKEWFIKFSIFKSEKFKNSELGRIPESCQVKDIYAIANVIYGAPFKSNLFNTDKKGIPVIRIRDLKNQEFKTYTEEKHPKGYLLRYGDIAVGMDGEFKPYIWANGEAWLNQRVCVFDNIRKNGKAFLYYTLKPLLNYVESTETATTVIHIGKNDFDKFKIVLPNDEVLNKFDKVTTPLIEKIINNIKENETLKQLRDTLLPKLMNGEIDLENTEI